MSGSAGHAGTATSAADSVPPEFTNDPMSLAQAKLHINSILREINGGKEVHMDSACENVSMLQKTSLRSLDLAIWRTNFSFYSRTVPSTVHGKVCWASDGRLFAICATSWVRRARRSRYQILLERRPWNGLVIVLGMDTYVEAICTSNQPFISYFVHTPFYIKHQQSAEWSPYYSLCTFFTHESQFTHVTYS